MANERLGSSIRTARWFDPLQGLRVATLDMDASDRLFVEDVQSGARLTLDQSRLLSEKADLDGAGTASLSNYASIDTEHLDFSDDTLDAPVEIGLGSSVGDDRGISIGKNADAGGSAEGAESIAIGVGATATPDLSGNGESDAIAIGRNATANQLRTIAIGGYDDGNAQGAEATEDDAIAIGANSEASGDDCISIGQGSQATSSTTNGSVAIGKQARATKELGVAIGVATTAFGAEGTAVGAGAGADSLRSVAIGRNAAAQDDATAIGRGTTAGANNSVAIGSQTSVSTAGLGRIGGEVNQFVWPGTRDTVADADLQTSELTVELDETNGAFRLRGKDSGGTVREATVAW